MKRKTDISAIENEIFDLIIIGGGITGAGILMEAARTGYRCLLLEKGDFASGTSSKSAKLIHGGIRYLKYGKIGMIKESLDERNYLLKTYPHLVKPLPFLFPVYDSTFKYRVGMAIYHFLSNDETLPDYRYFEKADIIRLFPDINHDGLQGGFIYYDAVTNDARLCNEVLDDAQRTGNAYALNYCEVTGMSADKPVSVIHCFDHLEHQNRRFNARYILNASGVWMDEVLKLLTSHSERYAAPSKGVHIVLPKARFPFDNAVIIPSHDGDSRLLYSVPWENNSVIIGTTDTDYHGDLDHPVPQSEDVEYILKSIRKFSPVLQITRDDILHVYSGLRPLYSDCAASYDRSRDYKIWWQGDNLLNIMGGKLTSFHSMAESMLEELSKKILPPENIPASAQSLIPQDDAADLPEKFTDHIREKYLEKAIEIFSIAREHPENTTRLHPDFDATVAEAIYFIRILSCYHLDDLLTRRFSLSFVLQGCHERNAVVEKAARILQQENGWTAEESQDEISQYKNRYFS